MTLLGWSSTICPDPILSGDTDTSVGSHKPRPSSLVVTYWSHLVQTLDSRLDSRPPRRNWSRQGSILTSASSSETSFSNLLTSSSLRSRLVSYYSSDDANFDDDDDDDDIGGVILMYHRHGVTNAILVEPMLGPLGTIC